MYKKKPFFIVFEGVEGCGKSYQSKKLFNNLKKKKIDTVLTREPGGTKSAELIRNLILKDYFHVSDTDINSKELVDILDSKRCKEYIFTGGGILRPDILSKNVKFIHVHPGNIINYRGSTCFYYSYLNQKLIECTTFYMSENIDRGDVLDISKIKINLTINSDQKLFIDYILDPTVRALSLQRFLRLNTDRKINQIDTFENSDCYLIHPALRYLFFQKINENYNPKNDSGIFINDR